MNELSAPRQFSFSRRDFVLTASALAGVGVLSGCARKESETSPEAQDFDAVTALIRQMFPHDGIAQSTYADIAVIVRQKLNSEANWPSLQAEGAAAFEAQGDWAALDDAGRVAAAKVISDTAFFKTVYQTALFEFYSHSDVWRHLGYPGASWPEGGYINRGFDDINWLPEDPQ